MRSKKAGKAATKPRRRRQGGLRRLLIRGGLLALAASVVYLGYLDWQVRSRFEGKRWALPAQVFARPLELYPGLARTAPDIERELQALDYRAVRAPRRSGTYQLTSNHLTLISQPFQF